MTDDTARKAVPREATDAMLAAAMRAEKEYGDESGLPYGSAWRVMFDAAPVLAAAPAEPPKDGEVAALIERLRKPKSSLPFGDTRDEEAAEAADALARLSAPVPDKPMPLKFTNEWLKEGIESDGDDDPSAGDSPCTR